MYSVQKTISRSIINMSKRSGCVTLQVQHVNLRLVLDLTAIFKLAAKVGCFHKRSSEGITGFIWSELKPAGVCRQKQ